MTADRPFADARQVASLIDHTLLKPEAAQNDVLKVCEQALECQFASVCVNPHWVPLVSGVLKGSLVKTCAVIGFPLGANRAAVKLEEAWLALTEGAAELDMVLNVGALRTGDTEAVKQEIRDLASAAHGSGALLKVILETCLLTEEQKTVASKLAQEAGADFVKTSTGFSTGGATEADVRLMRSVVGPAMGVKASGGIRTLGTLTSMVLAGANRIGSSSGVQILAELRNGALSHDAGADGTY